MDAQNPDTETVLPPEAWVEILLAVPESAAEMTVGMRVGAGPYRGIIPVGGEGRLELHVQIVIGDDGVERRTYACDLDIISADARSIAAHVHQQALAVFMRSRNPNTDLPTKAAQLKFRVLDQQGKSLGEHAYQVSRKHVVAAVDANEVPEVNGRLLLGAVRLNGKIHTQMFSDGARHSADMTKFMARHEVDMAKAREATVAAQGKLLTTVVDNMASISSLKDQVYKDSLLATDKLARAECGGGFFNTAAGERLADTMAAKSAEGADLLIGLGKLMLRSFSIKLDEREEK